MLGVDTPDVEGIVIKLLEPLGVRRATKIPNPRPVEFIRVSLTGGSGGLVLDVPSVLVECWADSTVRAGELARQARSLLIDSQFDVVDWWQVYGIDCAYPAYYPDETSDRYQFPANVRVRRTN